MKACRGEVRVPIAVEVAHGRQDIAQFLARGRPSPGPPDRAGLSGDEFDVARSSLVSGNEVTDPIAVDVVQEGDGSPEVIVRLVAYHLVHDRVLGACGDWGQQGKQEGETDDAAVFHSSKP